MSMDYETNSSHYATSRTALWCPVCGAKEGQGCTPHNATITLRYDAHNAVATGTVPRPVIIPPPWGYSEQSKDARIPVLPARKDAKKPGWTPKGWA